MTESHPRLWVSQIPNFIVAYHTRGEFKDVRRQDIRADLLRWESENQDALRRLASLVRMIINYAKASSNAKLEIYRNDLDVLEIRKQAGDGRDALPPKVKSQWTQGEDASETRSTDWPEEEEDEPYIERVRGPSFSDSESEPDFTACSADHCGYCGHCTY